MSFLKNTFAFALCGAAMIAMCADASARPRHRAAVAAEAATAAPDDRFANAKASAGEQGVTEATTIGRETSLRTYGSSRERDAAHGRTSLTEATGNSLVESARRYMGGNPTGRGNLWCGAFLDMVLKQTGHKGGGNLARAYASYGRRVSGPQVGAIAVMSGHVGVVSGVDANGNPIVISGNHNRVVAESVYPSRRIIAYVMPE